MIFFTISDISVSPEADVVCWSKIEKRFLICSHLSDNQWILNLIPIKYYFLISGGYNTKRYGSRDSGMIDAIQIESSADQRSNEARSQNMQSKIHFVCDNQLHIGWNL